MNNIGVYTSTSSSTSSSFNPSTYSSSSSSMSFVTDSPKEETQTALISYSGSPTSSSSSSSLGQSLVTPIASSDLTQLFSQLIIQPDLYNAVEEKGEEFEKYNKEILEQMALFAKEEEFLRIRIIEEEREQNELEMIAKSKEYAKKQQIDALQQEVKRLEKENTDKTEENKKLNEFNSDLERRLSQPRIRANRQIFFEPSDLTTR